MKNFKKFASVLLAVVMVLSMSAISVFAEGTTYTISAPAGSSHTYKVFQIFKGDLSDGVLSNIKWGKNGSGTENNDVDKTVLDELEAVKDKTDSDKLAVIKKYAKIADGSAFGTVTKDAPLENVPAGYYLIKDADNSVTGVDAYTTYIVKVVKDVTITPKSDVPSSEKKVKDINDSTETKETDWQDSADMDIGDEVHYRIKATLPDDADAFAAYKTYFLNFVDDMSKGLTYKAGSAVVKVNGTRVDTLEPTEDEEATSAYEGGKVYRWEIADIKAAPYSAAAGDVVTIEYTCTLNEKAVIGKAGNPNKMHIEFDNNPNSEGDGEKGTTPDDVNIVFTYKVDVDKIDQDNKALEGAGFTLYKKDTAGNWNKIKDEVSGVTNFAWEGIDDGQYKLVETTVPPKYNKVADIVFTVTAEHSVLSDDPALTKFSVDNKDFTAQLDAGDITKKDTTKHKAVSGEIYGEIINQKGATLPETGGIGTTLFYIVGTVLVIGAGVLLVTRRRMSAQ